jgi:hypothetical protein
MDQPKYRYQKELYKMNVVAMKSIDNRKLKGIGSLLVDLFDSIEKLIDSEYPRPEWNASEKEEKKQRELRDQSKIHVWDAFFKAIFATPSKLKSIKASFEDIGYEIADQEIHFYVDGNKVTAIMVATMTGIKLQKILKEAGILSQFILCFKKNNLL